MQPQHVVFYQSLYNHDYYMMCFMLTPIILSFRIFFREQVPYLLQSLKGRAMTHKIGRDAKTGQYIPVKEANKRPNTTVVETVKTPQKKGK